jgi:hypothetical protein
MEITRDDLGRFVPEVRPVALDNGDTAFVRGMSGSQYEEVHRIIHAANQKMDGNLDIFQVPDLLSRIMLWCWCDGSGARLFDEANRDDWEAVGSLRLAVRTAIGEAAMEASGLGEKAVEDAAKNFESAPTG